MNLQKYIFEVSMSHFFKKKCSKINKKVSYYALLLIFLLYKLKINCPKTIAAQYENT